MECLIAMFKIDHSFRRKTRATCLSTFSLTYCVTIPFSQLYTVKLENYTVILLRATAFPNLYAHVIYAHECVELDLSFIFFFENPKYLEY